MTESAAYPLRHAVDRLPPSVTRRQAERARFIQRAEPAIDPGAPPQAIELTPGADFARRARHAFRMTGALALFVILFWWVFEASEPVDFLAPLALPALSAWFGVEAWRKARRYPSRLGIALTPTEVTMTSERGVWTLPVAAFRGVAVRGVELEREWSERRKRTRTSLERRQGVGAQTRWLYWIELTHADPDKSTPLWALEAGNDPMRLLVVTTAERFAKALGQPLLSTAGIGPRGKLAR